MSRKPVASRLDSRSAEKEKQSVPVRRKPKAMKAPRADEATDVFDPATHESPDEMPSHLPTRKGSGRWGLIFFACIGALVSLGLSLWFASVVERLFEQNGFLGWTATGVATLALLALVIVIIKEIAALWRLRKLGKIREDVKLASHGSGSGSETALKSIVSLYQNRRDMNWNLSRLAAETDSVMDPRDRLLVAERTLMKPLDDEAKSLIAGAAKRVAVVTAVNPAPSLDVLFTGYQILRMLRQIMNVYGSRPGSIGTLRLARMVGTHLAVTGGLALSDTLIQQFIGKGLAGRLSAKLGEGTVNGILTARIGLAAIELCRPMPFEALQKPGLREFLAVIAGANESKGA